MTNINHHEAALKAVLHVAQKAGLSVEQITLGLEKDIESGVGAVAHIPVGCSEEVIKTINKLGKDVKEHHSKK